MKTKFRIGYPYATSKPAKTRKSVVILKPTNAYTGFSAVRFQNDIYSLPATDPGPYVLNGYQKGIEGELVQSDDPSKQSIAKENKKLHGQGRSSQLAIVLAACAIYDNKRQVATLQPLLLFSAAISRPSGAKPFLDATIETYCDEELVSKCLKSKYKAAKMAKAQALILPTRDAKILAESLNKKVYKLDKISKLDSLNDKKTIIIGVTATSLPALAKQIGISEYNYTSRRLNLNFFFVVACLLAVLLYFAYSLYWKPDTVKKPEPVPKPMEIVKPEPIAKPVKKTKLPTPVEKNLSQFQRLGTENANREDYQFCTKKITQLLNLIDNGNNIECLSYCLNAELLAFFSKRAPENIDIAKGLQENCIKAAEKFEINGVPFEFVYVPTVDEKNQGDSFWIGKYEVSNKQYRCLIQKHHSGKFDADEQPVVNVSKTEAEEFCNQLSQQKPFKIRLPTQVEWEYAALGPGNFKQQYTHIEQPEPMQVNKYPSSASWCGALHMYGNVWELTQTLKTVTVSKEEHGKNVPIASRQEFVICGYSYHDPRAQLVDHRIAIDLSQSQEPTDKDSLLGFRLLLREKKN